MAEREPAQVPDGQAVATAGRVGPHPSVAGATPGGPGGLGRRRPLGVRLLISLLIAGLGLLASQALGIVDQDLRIIYTEYTLAAADLAHTSTDLLRYRITIIRAIEAPTRQEFDRIVASLPDQRARILRAVDRYAAASQRLSRGERSRTEDLQALRQSLDAYLRAADQTAILLARLWATSDVREAADLRHQAELHAAENAGPKLVEASDALERLLLGVADVGKDMRDESAGVIRATTLALVLGSLLIAALNLLA